MRRVRAVVVSFFCLLLVGCGYSWGRGGTVDDYQTICIPYVEGDYDGTLTNALIREMATSGHLRYLHSGGELILSLSILDFRVENIGFRYDRDRDGFTTNNVIPAETRITVLAELSLCESGSDCVVVGPDLVTASVDFDHDYYSNQSGVNVFSLGQLNDLDLAEEVAYRPLYRELAKRVAEQIYQSW